MAAEQSDVGVSTQAWLDAFAAAVAARDGDAMRELFVPEAYWRDVVALSGGVGTTHGADALVAALLPLIEAANPAGFALSTEHTPPAQVPRGTGEVVEAFYDFETDLFHCKGVVRLVPSESDPATLRALALMTSAQELKGHEEPINERRVDLHEAFPWSFESEDPAVLIVGAGQSGLCLAARLRMIGVPALVLEKNDRVGDNWRNRYEGLKLHNIIAVNQFPFMPFPTNYPTYLPKDLYGNWLETFSNSMDVEVWTETAFLGGSYEEAEGRWTARVDRAGEERVLHPQHVVMATGGFASVPNVPQLPGLEEFEGQAVHTTEVRSGAEFAGKKVLIVGTGTSGHDLAVELIANGCEVTMVQRSPTDVISQEAANIFLGLFVERPAEEVDLIVAANSMEVTRDSFKMLTQIAAEMDKDLIDGLEAVGFRTCLGYEDAGYFWDFLQTGGSYYIDVGACKYVLDGTIKIVQAADIERYGAKGAYLSDGSLIEADVVVLATGFAPQELEVEALFGADVAGSVGTIWGYGDDGELRNTWVATGQEGLWFMGGGIPHARDYSRYVALQIKTRLLGLEVGAGDLTAAS